MRQQLKKEQEGSKLQKALKEAMRRGELSGYHGRLGDLGTIAKEYDCAVTTACGQLDSFVVDTTSDAEKCIQYLRQEKLGRAQFICLDRVTEVWTKYKD